MSDKFLVTGSMGCIGAWVLRNLVDEGADVVATDLATDPVRPGLLLSEQELTERITWAKLDVTDLDAVRGVVDGHGITHIVHLAGLQIPFCRANPSLGAAVNVLGTVNVLDAARHAGDRAGDHRRGLRTAAPATLRVVEWAGHPAQHDPASDVSIQTGAAP